MQIDMGAMKAGALGISDEDLRVWELVTDVPVLKNVTAYVCLILNIILPGVGTLISACLGD